MGATFARVKTWTTETLTDSDLNGEFDNILNNLTPAGIDDESAADAAMQATADPYPAAAISKPTSLQGELQRLRYLIKQITGETHWYIDPDNNIATLHADLETAKTDITNALVLTPAPGTDLLTSGPTATLQAGEALAHGDFCYMNSSGKMVKGDADAIGTSGVFAMAKATIENDATGLFALPGSFIRKDAWNWGTVGAYVYLDTATAGGLTQTAPTATDAAIQIVGVATHADRIYFNPQLLMYIHA